MFKDYYAILNIPVTASQQEIKSAYRRQASKWHPDRNPGIDTTEIIQLINEAYLILKDAEAKERYDKEYIRFKQSATNNNSSSTNQHEPQTYDEPKKYYYPEYEMYDKTLEEWIINAGIQAIRLAKEAITEFAKETAIGIVSGIKNAVGYAILIQIFFGILLLLFFLSSTCNK